MNCLSRDIYKLVSKDINEFKSGEEIQRQIISFLILIDERNADREVEIFLKGYVYNHEELCLIEDCPLKAYKHILDKNYRKDNFHSKFNKKNNPNIYLFKYVNYLFNLGISKFPNCTALRISHGIFLWERLRNKNLALHEFNSTELYYPAFDQEFILFRYRKIILEEEEMNTEGETLDLVEEIAFESHYRQCILY